jgi:hypothetical protein
VSTKRGNSSSRIGARYRHTTDAMAVRVIEAIEARLTVVLRKAEALLDDHPNRSTFTIS